MSSRPVWGGVMLLSLLMTGASAYYIATEIGVDKLLEHEPQASVSDPIEQPVLPSKPEEPVKPVEPDQPKEAVKETSTTRNILFKLPKPKAQAVFIIGDFNDWKRTAMVKKEKAWELSVALQPGTYKYLFVVEDKRIKDPNNKNTVDGKSVITVKPLSSNN